MPNSADHAENLGPLRPSSTWTDGTKKDKYQVTADKTTPQYRQVREEDSSPASQAVVMVVRFRLGRRRRARVGVAAAAVVHSSCLRICRLQNWNHATAAPVDMPVSHDKGNRFVQFDSSTFISPQTPEPFDRAKRSDSSRCCSLQCSLLKRKRPGAPYRLVKFLSSASVGVNWGCDPFPFSASASGEFYFIVFLWQ